jgi:DnaA-homolog protein
LPFDFQLPNEATFENFYPGLSAEFFCAIKAMVQGGGEPFLYLWGARGHGKTHLLQAATTAVVERGCRAFYVSFKNLPNLSLSCLAGLETLSLVVLDDLEYIAKQSAWEHAIFSLFNVLREKKVSLLVSAICPPRALSFNLLDLTSRLSWGVAYQLPILTDPEKLIALQKQAYSRGLLLNNRVGLFLLKRCPRDLPLLFRKLASLDRASLAEQRALTIPFVKKILDC